MLMFQRNMTLFIPSIENRVRDADKHPFPLTARLLSGKQVAQFHRCLEKVLK